MKMNDAKHATKTASERIIYSVLLEDDSKGNPAKHRYLENEAVVARSLTKMLHEQRIQWIREGKMTKWENVFAEIVRFEIRKTNNNAPLAFAIAKFHKDLIGRCQAGSWSQVILIVMITQLVISWTKKLVRANLSRFDDPKRWERKIRHEITQAAVEHVVDKSTDFLIKMGGWNDILLYEKSRTRYRVATHRFGPILFFLICVAILSLSVMK